MGCAEWLRLYFPYASLLLLMLMQGHIDAEVEVENWDGRELNIKGRASAIKSAPML